MRVHLLHTNDVHSNLENFMRLGASLRALRDEIRGTGEFVLTFDIGDLLDRVRPETEVTLGDVNSAMLGALSYDGWVFGNNEGLSIPVERWPELARSADTTVFGSNLRQLDGSPFPCFHDWRLYHVGDVQIGVFGLTANYTIPYQVLGALAHDPFERARAVVLELRTAGADVIVALSHLGLHEDRVLANRVEGIDVILGGHTHQFMQAAETVNRTTIFQPGKHALVYGHTVIDYDQPTQSVSGVTSHPIRVDLHGPLDQEMLTSYQAFQAQVTDTLAEPVAVLDRRLDLRLGGESPFANVFVDALFDEYPCDLGLVNAGMLTASLLRGTVQRQHVLGACSTPTRAVSLTLSGSAIAAILEKAAQPSTYMKMAFGFGFRGSVVGFMAVANAVVTLRTDDAGSVRLQSVTVGGQPLVWKQDYRVVTCEYLWLGPIFETFREGRDVVYHAPLAREILMKRLNDGHSLGRGQRVRYVEDA